METCNFAKESLDGQNVASGLAKVRSVLEFAEGVAGQKDVIVDVGKQTSLHHYLRYNTGLLMT